MNLQPSAHARIGFAVGTILSLVACGDPPATPSNSVMYVPPLTGMEQHAAPELAGAAGVPAPAQPAAEPAQAAAVPNTAMASPPMAAPAANPPPASGATPAVTPPPPAAAPATPAFDAGSGKLEADGKTVVFHIADGTGGKDWNPSDKPIKVRRGMTLRLIDDDKSTRSGGHWLHTNGQPCPHALRAIGTGFDCVISRNAPYGVVSGTFEHNVANGLGRIYIEVVPEAAAPTAK